MDATGPRTPPSPSPEDLLRRWRETGEPEALGDLFDTTSPPLFRLALTLAPDAASAEDAVQETFLVLLDRAGDLDLSRPLVPWLVGVLRHKVAKVRERYGPRRIPWKATPPAAAPDPAEEAGRHEEEERVREAVADLEEPYRRTALLRWRHGLEPAEIAEVLGERPGTVRMRLHRALEAIRKRFVALPALLLLREGKRVPRGLAAVRDEILRRAPVPAGAAAAGAGAAFLLGGVLVANKILIGGAVVVAAIGAWLLARPGVEEVAVPRAGGIPVARVEVPPSSPLEGEAEIPRGQSTALLPPGAARATGLVVDREGRPVPGARVTSFPGNLARPVTPADGEREGSGILAAVAGPDGRFEVELSRLAPRATLLATAPGFTPGVLAEVIDGEEARLVLDRAAAVTGIVVDGEGNPVHGARVRVRRLLDAMILDREGVSGADGRFRVEEVAAAVPMHGSRPAADMVAVEARAAGFGPFFSGTLFPVPAALAAGSGWEVRILLARGWTLRGRVVEAAGGAPVAGARVLAWESTGGLGFGRSNGSSMSPAFSPRLLGEELSGPDGAFVLPDLPARGASFEGADVGGILNNRFFGGVGAGKEGRSWTSVRLDEAGPGEEREVVLSLEPTGAVEGRVVDGEGRGLTGVSVFVNAAGGTLGGGLPAELLAEAGTRAETDGGGRYRLPSVPGSEGGPRTVILQAATRDFFRRSLTPEEGVRVEAVPGRTTTAPDIVLPAVRQPFADLLVTDGAGRPVWGARVIGAREMRAQVTDREGRARVPGLLDRSIPGNPLPLRACVRARGHGAALVDLAPGFEEREPVAVVLGPPHVLAGRVVEADGGPSPAASVSVDSAEPRLAAASPEDGTLGGAVSAEDGSFRVEDLPAGPFRVTVRGRSLFSGGSVPGEKREVVLEDVMAGAADLDIRFPPPAVVPAGAVEGVVTDAETGLPLLRCDAELSGPGGFFMAPRVRDNPGGRFRIEGVPAGTWRLQVFVEGYAPFVEEGIVVAAGASPAPVAVAVSRGATVTGRLQGPAGFPLAGCTLSFNPADPKSPWSEGGAQAKVAEDGSYRVAGLRAGTYRATLWRAGGAEEGRPPHPPAPGGAQVVPPRGGGGPIEPPHPPCGTLTVSVRDPRFPPGGFELVKPTEEQAAFGKGSRLLLLDGAGRTVREASPVWQGTLNLGFLALLPGEYAVRLETPAGARDERATVEAGKESSAVFRGE